MGSACQRDRALYADADQGPRDGHLLGAHPVSFICGLKAHRRKPGTAWLAAFHSAVRVTSTAYSALIDAGRAAPRSAFELDQLTRAPCCAICL
jgi:hypothetical protein